MSTIKNTDKTTKLIKLIKLAKLQYKIAKELKEQKSNMFATPARLEDLWENCSDGSERAIAATVAMQAFNFAMDVASIVADRALKEALTLESLSKAIEEAPLEEATTSTNTYKV